MSFLQLRSPRLANNLAYVAIAAAMAENPHQYDSDNLTAIATGGTSATGSASGIYLDFDVRPSDLNDASETEVLTPYVEVRNNATPFSDTATVTGSPIYYNTDEPRALRSSPIVYDPIGKRYLMFSGSVGVSSTEINELWELKLTPRGKWRKLNPTGTYPTARYMGGLSFDTINNQLVVVFGYDTNDTNTLYYCSFTGNSDGAWVSRTPAGTPPSIRSNINNSVVTDFTNNCAYVFGGWGASYYNGLFKLTFSSGTPGGTWSTLKADGAAGSPSARRNATMVLDTQNNRLIIFGGNNSTANLNDTWQYNLTTNTFTQMSTVANPTTPGLRELHNAGYDPINHRMFMSGGYSGTTPATVYDEYWTLDLHGNDNFPTWTPQAPAYGYKPLQKYGATMAYDPDDKVLVKWGGVDSSGDWQHQVTFFDVTETSNIMEYGLGMNHFMRPMDAPSPVYNPDTGETVFVGGYSQMDDNTTIADGGHVNDVFAYNHTTNTWRVASRTLKTFFHREGVMTAYDTINDRIIAFGGLWGVGATNQGYLNDVWEIKANNNGDYDIRRMLPNGTPPGTRWLGVPAFDAVNNRFIVTMGGNGTSNWNDVWALNLASGDGTWTQLTPTGTAPTGAWAVGNAYDSTNRKLYIWGGCTVIGGEGTYSSQMLVLDLSTTNGAWTTLAAYPNTVRSTSQGIDIANGKIISFGGYNGTVVNNNTYIYTISSNTWSAAIVPATAPAARRSSGGWFNPNDGKFYTSHGRPVSGTWYGDTWAFTPNYATPANSTWADEKATHSVRASVPVTGLANSTAYHWQAWTSSSTGTSLKVARGGNPDFILGSVAATLTKIHSTSANKTKSGLSKFHTTDANKLISGNTRSHSTDTVKRRQVAISHTTDAIKRKQAVVTQLTDALKRRTPTISHTTSANKRTAGLTRSHNTDSYKLVVPSISTLQDRLLTYDTSKWIKAGDVPANVSFTNGQLEISVASGVVQFNQYDSIASYNWANAGAFIKIRTPATTNVVSQEAGLQYIQSAGNLLWFFVGGGLIKAYKQVVGVQAQIGASITYDSVNHAYLRIREAAGTWYFDTSADGTTWVNRYTLADPFGGNKIGIARIYSQHWQSETTTTTDGYSNFNMVVAPVTYTTSHSTDALKRKQSTVSHATDAIKRKQSVLSHTTDSLRRKQNTKFHTTDALKRITGLTRSHTTDANKRKSGLVKVHSTDANKRIGGLTRSHSTDTNKRVSGLTRVHSTDANKRISGFTRSHSTDSFKSARQIRSHSTDTLKTARLVKSHTTDTIKRAQVVRTHLTDAVLRRQQTKFHTSDSFKRIQTVISHLTDGLKRKQALKSHTTDANRRKALSVAHSTDSNKRRTTSVSHTTSANKRKTLSVFHTTGANKRVSGITRVHSTDAVKRISGLTRAHSTDANKRVATSRNHLTNALLRKANVVSHSTDSNKRSVSTVNHTTSASILFPPLHTFTDDFSDGIIAPWSPYSHTGYSTVTEQNGRMELAQNASAGPNGFNDDAEIENYTHYDFRNSYLSAQILALPPADPNRYAQMYVYPVGGNWTIAWTYRNGNLVAETYVGNTPTTIASFTYDPVAHANWRLRESGGTGYYETSPDGKTWTNRASVAMVGSGSNVYVGFVLNTFVAGSPALFAFDNINLIPNPSYAITHSTSAVKRTSGLTRSHSTDAVKRVAGLTRTHTTDAVKRISGIVRSHTTDTYLRVAFYRSHSTDALKRTQNTRSHTSDALKRKQNIRTHLTDALKRKQNTKLHTTDALKRKAITRVHTTDANKRISGLIRVHTTDANKRISGFIRVHSTDALKRTQNVLTQSTDTLKRTQTVKTHSTDAVKRRQIVLAHTTDANKRISGITRVHTTDSNKRKTGLTRLHTTDANKRTSGLVRSHLTDALKRVAGLVRTHTTDTLLRRQIIKSHSTDSLKRRQLVLSQSTDALVRKANVKTHTTDSNKRKTFIVIHSTDANKRIAGLLRSHTTDANKRVAGIVRVHSTDSLKRKQNVVSQTTDALKRKQNVKTHTTDTLKRVSGLTRSHSTDALKRAQIAKTHTTDTLKRALTVKIHSTDTLKRKQNVISHTTSANKRVAGVVRTHTTDSLLRRQIVKTHSTDANKRKTTLLVQSTDSNKRKQNVKSHSTDAFKLGKSNIFHNTDAFKHYLGIRAHSTDANKKVVGLTRSHSTGASIAFGTEYRTDFTNYGIVDATPPGWTQRWTTTDSFYSTVDRGDGKAELRHYINPNTTKWERQLSWDFISSLPGAADIDVTTRTMMADVTGWQSSIYLRGNGASSNQNSYQTQLHNQTLDLSRYITASNWVDLGSTPFSYSNGQWVWLRLRVVGNTMQAKAWIDGQVEPAGWMVTATNSEITATGWHGVGGYDWQGYRYYNFVSMAVGGARPAVRYLRTHATDAYTRTRLNMATHGTDTNKRKAVTLSHTTDTLKSIRRTSSHLTDANKRKSLIASHTTSAFLRAAGKVTHATDANKKIAGLVRSHTTSAVLRKQVSRVHSTDSLKRKQNTLSHSTGALVRAAKTKVHTTDANKLRTYSVLHTTSANKRASGVLRSHTTDALKRQQLVKQHSTDTLKRRNLVLTHSTDTNKRKGGLIRFHLTDAVRRNANATFQLTDTLKRIRPTLSHSTSSFIRRQIALTHKTDANKRVSGLSRSHSTDAMKRLTGLEHFHLTNALKRKQNTIFFTTDSNKRKQNTKFHTTDAARDYPPLNSLIDNFNNNTLNTSLWRYNSYAGDLGQFNGTVTVTNQKLRITLPANAYTSGSWPNTGNASTGVDTPYFNMFGGNALYAQFVTIPDNSRIATMGVIAPNGGGRNVGWIWQYQNGNLVVITGTTAMATFPYDPVNHKWLRIREQSGNILMETSPTSDVWTLRYSFIGNYTYSTLAQVYASVYMEQIANSSSAGLFEIDNINTNGRAQFTPFHKTDTKIYKQFLQTHNTDTIKRKSVTRVHTTSAFKYRQGIKTHLTDANLRKTLVINHLTDSVTHKLGTVNNTTDALKRKQNVVIHSTDANKRKAVVRVHTTDTLLRKLVTRTYTTDALKRAQTVKTHLTDALKRKTNTISHSTSANKRKTSAVTHITDALIRKQFTVTQRTDALKRISGLVRSHTTDAFKRALQVKTHTTDALKRVQFTKLHTTSAVIRKQFSRSFTTDANKRKTINVLHLTDANKRKGLSVSHLTDALKRKINTRFHTTDTLKRILTAKSHLTDSLLRRAIAKIHTTDAVLRRQLVKLHTTDSLKRKQNVRTHSTDALKRKTTLVTQKTDANKRKALSVFHTTSAVVRRISTIVHSTDTFKRVLHVLTHTTNTLLRAIKTVSHSTNTVTRGRGSVQQTTDALKRAINAVQHATSANLRRAGLVKTHSTDANKRKSTAVAHSTNTLKRKSNILTQRTDAFKRIQTVVSHLTDALLRVRHTISQSTDTVKNKPNHVSHTTDLSVSNQHGAHHLTDASKWSYRGTKKVLVNGVWHYGVVKVLIDGEWQIATIKWFDGTTWKRSDQ